MGLFSGLYLLFICSLSSGAFWRQVNAENTWCMAKPSSSEEQLQSSINFACGHTSVDCSPIKEEGSCFYLNSYQHACFAMNDFYQINGRSKWHCDFNNTGLITLTDPGYGSCSINGGETKGLDKTKTWCVAKPGIDDNTLLSNINSVCSKENCKNIQEGGSCFYPTSLMNHASVVMNMFSGKANCDFGNSGAVVLTDPSYDSCSYA